MKQESILKQLESLDSTFRQSSEKVELALSGLDEGGKERTEQRKQIIRKEHSKALLYLNFKDGETVRLLKSATMEALLEAKQVVTQLRKSIEVEKNSQNLIVIQSKLEEVVEQVEYLRRNTELSIGVDSAMLASIMEKSVYIKTKDCDPKKFQLLIDNDHSMKVKVLTEAPHSFNTDFIRNTMFISFSAVNHHLVQTAGVGAPGIPILRETLREAIRSRRALLLTETCLELQLPASPTGYAELDVTIFGVAITNGCRRPICPADNRAFSGHPTTNGNTSCFLDESVVALTQFSKLSEPLHRSLDASDIHSLDMTKRNKLGHNTDHENDDGTNGVSLPRALTTNGHSSLATITEVDGGQEAPKGSKGGGASTFDLSATNPPFSPGSEAQYSTMRDTSEHLVKLASSVELPEGVVNGDQDVVLSPSSSGMSVDEMQSSLSGNNSNLPAFVDVLDMNTPGQPNAALAIAKERKEEIFHNHRNSPGEKSLNFATKTTIYSHTDDNDNSTNRYRIEQGDTKAVDGVAGLTRRPNPPELAVTDANTSGGFDSSFWHSDEKEADLTPFEPLLVVEDANYEMDCTMWEEEPENQLVNFLTGSIFHTTTQKHKRGYSGPAHISYLPTFKMIIVTQPRLNRIGVHDASSLILRGWFLNKNTNLNHPLNMAVLADTDVVVEQAESLCHYRLLGTVYSLVESIAGQYKGAATANEGLEVLSLLTVDTISYVKIFSLNKENRLVETESIELTVAVTVRKDASPTPANLASWQDTIYITDPGLGRVYIVDRTTRHQFSVGHYGDGMGMFKKPVGILVDEMGNFLVSDNETSTILLFNKKGQWVRNIQMKDTLKRPMGMLRLDDSIIVCYMGEEDGQDDQGFARLVYRRTN